MNDNHPLLLWLGTLISRDAVELKGRDVHLSVQASKEFGLGIQEGNPVLYFQKQHREALSSVRWNAAAFILNSGVSDWVVLSCADLRVQPSERADAVPMRMFVRVERGRLSGWVKSGADTLHLKAFSMGTKGPDAETGSADFSIPLIVKAA